MASHGDCDSRIVQLARIISTCVTNINDALLEIGLPSPSFDENTPVAHLPPGISDYQDTVLDATAELHDLLLEPLHLIKKHSGVSNFQSSWAYQTVRVDLFRATTQYASKPSRDMASQT